jgi:peptidoglycan pentaglycine glycine transferase (the first glycine)
MDIQRVDNRENWDFLLKQNKKAGFFQSWQWGEFQASVGNEPLRLQMHHDGAALAQVQGFVHRLPLGMQYVYFPRFEIVRDGEDAAVNPHQISKQTYGDVFFEYIRRNKYLWSRVEPVKHLEVAGQRVRPTKNRQPQDTLIVDISKSKDDLLQAMHSKTRYNIRLAEKKGVEVRSEKNIDVFWQLNTETTQRDGFSSHGKAYYTKMLALDMVHQLTAYYEGIPIASNILIVFGNTCTYLHGASSNQHRNVMAPYALQWHGMELGKSLGASRYDFWGIAPAPEKHKSGPTSTSHGLSWQADHRFTGVTRFKAGFGGVRESYAGAKDIVHAPLPYVVYTWIKNIRS